MKIFCAAAGAALFFCSFHAFAQTEVACGQTLDAALQARSMLTIDSRPAGLQIIGTDKETLHVSCTADDMESAQHIRLRFTGSSDSARLTIAGSYLKHGNLEIRIEVPRKISLRVKMPAGAIKVEEIAGDKDIDLYAGQISVSSDHEWNYRRVDVSVAIGQVNAPVYGANKGGFFRSFTMKQPNGEYHLHAHVTTGQIDLIGAKAHVAAD